MKIIRFNLCVVITTIVVVFLFSCIEQKNRSTDHSFPDPARNKWGQFALLVIDIQHYFWNEKISRDFPEFPENISALLNFCRTEGIDIVHLRARFEPDMSDWPSYFKLRGKIPCVKGTEGEKVWPFAKDVPGETVIYKHGFDGFLDTELSDYLRRHNKKHLLVAGVDTGVCVINTCFSAFQRGYLLTLLEDCCAGEINAHKFITKSYNGFIFETIRFEDIAEKYPFWLNRLDQLESIEEEIERHN